YSSIPVTPANATVESRDTHHPAVCGLAVVTPEDPLSVTIRLSAEDAPQSGGFNVYVYGLNMAAFQTGYDILARGAMQVTAFSDTMIKGAVNAPRDGLLYTSIPYDEGWQVIIDGKRVPVSKYVGIGIQDEQREVKSIGFSKPRIEKYTKKVMKDGKPAQVTRWRLAGGFKRTAVTERVRGGLLGVPLSAGTHTVELRYVPQGYRMGLIISAGALMLLGLCGLLGVFLPRRKRAPGAAAPLFSFEGLRPENFSLDLEEEPIGAEPEDDALPPFLEAGEGEPEAEDAQAPPEDEDLLPPDPSLLTPPPAPPPEPPAAPDINAMLQEMQARAEQLRRKMRVEDSNGGEGQEFRLV
ncbi:MAG: YfhO family protein, partial [Oscillospiraceae bacterium]|nr:YfhO family protein [Oscillospiraceae bacterium]